jgi:1,2-diacylglycerol 3-alpha-glucosyltransferase
MAKIQTQPIKVYLVNTGVGIVRRGIESFVRECFEGLRGTDGLHIELFKGAGEDHPPDEHRLPCIPRTHALAKAVAGLTGRTGYLLEQLSAFPALARHIWHGQPDIVFLGDGRLALRLCRWMADRTQKPFGVLFSNGSPVAPPFTYAHHVQQINPFLLQEALAAGEPVEKHSLVPYGIRVPEGAPISSPILRSSLRENLDLPVGRALVLSVGWISREHKRMDYVVEEIAALPPPRPFLILLGHMDKTSQPVIELAERRLGTGNFLIRSVPYEQVTNYYAVADVFVLASLFESFGRVYLEALSAGLPCVAHDHPTMRYVLDTEGSFADLSKPGAMAALVMALLARPNLHSPEARAHRRESVRARFSWEVLAPAYMEMFRRCMQRIPG